jgi:hypothetical protein
MNLLFISNHHHIHFFSHVQSLHNPTRTNCLPEILPEFQRIFGESFRRFTKSALCWQFCWQLQLGSSQLVDAQASELEAEVGIGHFSSPLHL